MDKGQEKVLKLHKVHFINESNTFIVRLVKNSEKKNETEISQGIPRYNLSVK